MSHLSRRSLLATVLVAGSSSWASHAVAQGGKPPGRTQFWPLKTPRPTGIHDLAPAPDGDVWFTAQRSGHLGWFNPKDGHADLIPLGSSSSPHDVIQGPDGAAWITDSGLNAIVRVSWPQREVRRFALPEGTPYANLNTCAFDGDGDPWFTGQSGVIGKVAVKTGMVTVRDAPGGRGPYGICSTLRGEVWWCSLAGSFIARIDRRTGESLVVQPPTKNQGARRIWSDSAGRIWVSEWNSGNCPCTIRPTAAGGHGSRTTRTHAATRSTSTSATSSGSLSGAATLCSASTRWVNAGIATTFHVRASESARYWIARARSGCRGVARSTSQ